MVITKKHKIIFASVIAAILLSVLFFVIYSIRSKYVNIGFYQIPDEVQTALEEKIKEIPELKISFHKFNSEKSLTKKAAKNYSIIFTYNSRTAINLKPHEIESATLDYLPTKIRYSTSTQNKNYGLPVLLDHFGLSLYRTYQNELALNPPQTLSDLRTYLTDVKQKADFPLVVIGADDTELFGFVSSYAQSFYSVEDYYKLCSDLNKAQSTFSDLPESLTIVLDELNKLKKDYLLYPNWISITQLDAENLLKNHQVGTLASFLSTQRKLPYVYIKYFDTVIFPQNDTNVFGVIAPAITACKLKNGKTSDTILRHLVKRDSQTDLSTKTMLAPAASLGESRDSQADDARFWSAASPAGPLPSLKEACFLSQSRAHDYAQKIREYLK